MESLLEPLIPLTQAASGDEVTVYVKGFLARGENAEHFDAWVAGHHQLCASHGWSPHAVGYRWESGTLQSFALPVASAAKTAWDIYRLVRHARKIAPLASAGWFIAEQGTALSIRFVGQFFEARRQAATRAEDFAGCLAELAAKHRRVRVVAHSLGCRQVIEAAALLPRQERPYEVHLCAPACLEEEVGDKLDNIASAAAFLYYTDLDHVLDLSFRAISQGRAIGAAGLTEDYEGLTLRDVSHAFDFWVHTEYKNRFSRFAERPVPLLEPAHGEESRAT